MERKLARDREKQLLACEQKETALLPELCVEQ